MTARQHAAWQAWLEWEQERPSRADYYQMATTAEIRSYVYMRAQMDPRTIKLDDLRLVPVVDQPAEQPDEQARLDYETSLSKAAATLRVGGVVREVPAELGMHDRPPEVVIEEQPDWTWRG